MFNVPSARLHSENAKLCADLLGPSAQCSLQAHAEHVPGLRGRDDAVVPQPGGREGGVTLALDAVAQFRVDRLAHGLHDGRELVGAHDADLRVGPHPQEPGAVGAPAHAVVAGPGARADDDGELGHLRARDGGDELRPVLGDAALLGVGADHEARDVLQEHQGDVALAAQLDEVGALERRLGKQDAVVRHDPDAVAVDAREARDQGGAVVLFELGELAAVDDARDDLVHGDLLPQVGAHDAGQFLGVVEGLSNLGGGRPFSGVV